MNSMTTLECSLKNHLLVLKILVTMMLKKISEFSTISLLYLILIGKLDIIQAISRFTEERKDMDHLLLSDHKFFFQRFPSTLPSKHSLISIWDKNGTQATKKLLYLMMIRIHLLLFTETLFKFHHTCKTETSSLEARLTKIFPRKVPGLWLEEVFQVQFIQKTSSNMQEHSLSAVE